MEVREERAAVIAIMVPLPAQSHLNQVLQLAYRISSYDIPVHYVGSPIHNRQVKNRAQGLNLSEGDKIQFHDFPVPDSKPLPEPDDNLKCYSYLVPSFEASLHLREAVAALLHELAQKAKRIVVVHDVLVSSVVQDAASIPNAETYILHTVSAFALFCGVQDVIAQKGGKPLEMGAEMPKRIPLSDGCLSKGMREFTRNQVQFSMMKAGDLFSTCRLMEGTFLDLLPVFPPNVKKWAIGPLNPIKVGTDAPSNDRHSCFEWLDKQAPRSVLYVSFGTTTYISDEQIKELALGLEQSKVKFLWVLRDLDKGNTFTGERTLQLPEGFETRIEGQGMAVREWAPQLEILGHKSIGGFMSHCGWGSCMESISRGVPIAAWPMHSDQPNNAALVTEYLKVGILVRKWEHRKELVSSSVISQVASKLIGSEEGEELRKKARELGCTLHECVTKGGASQQELEGFIAHITR